MMQILWHGKIHSSSPLVHDRLNFKCELILVSSQILIQVKVCLSIDYLCFDSRPMFGLL